MIFVILSYLVVLVAFLIFNGALYYHILRFSYPGDSSRKILKIYASTIGFIILLTFILLFVI